MSAAIDSSAEGRIGLKPSVSNDTAGDGYPQISSARAVLLVFILTLCMALNIVSVQAIIIAIPQVSLDLGIKTSQQQWLSSAYACAFGSVLLFFGRLADLYGSKKLWLAGMIFFGAFNVGAGFAPNEIALDLMRALQGVGMAAAVPASLGILGRTFRPGQAKSTAFATFSAGAPLGGATGNVIGGVLVQYASWRSIFWVTAGTAAFVTVCGWFLIPRDTEVEQENRSLDWIGAGLTVSGLTLATFALADGSSAPKGWATPYVPVLLGIGILLLVAFWFWEAHLEKSGRIVPIMRTRLWFKGRFAIVQLIACLGWSAFASQQFFATLYFQDYLRLTPIETTLRFLPSPVTGLILNVVMAFVASRVPAQFLLLLGAVGTGLAPTLFATQRVGDPFWQWQFPAAILNVFGADFIYATGIMYVSKVADQDEQALAGGVFNCLTQIGTSLGLAVNSEIQTQVARRELLKIGVHFDPDTTIVPKEILLKSLRSAFWGCASFAFFAAIIAATCLVGIGKVGEKTSSSALLKLKNRRKSCSETVDDRGIETETSPVNDSESQEKDLDALAKPPVLALAH